MDDAPLADSVAEFSDISSWLWWLSVAFYGIGDLLTTTTTELWDPLVEGSPIVGLAVHSHGLVGLFVLKFAIFAAAYALWLSLAPPHNVGVPLALSVLGIGLTTWNMVVIGYTMAG